VKKQEWCGHSVVIKVWEYVYFLWHNAWRTDRHNSI